MKFFSKKTFKINIKSLAFFLVIFLFIILNISNSSLPYLTTYKWLKFFEFFILGLYIYKNINLKKDFENIIKTLSIGLIFESLLAISQFLSQSSENGIFYWFGERFFNASTSNISRIAIKGELFLRPPATFPHPNVLAGYSAIILPLILVTDFKPIKIKWLAFDVSLSALFLTFSRPAVFIGLFAILIAWIIEQRKFFFLTLTVLIFSLLFILNISAIEKESIDRRISLNQTSIAMFLKKPTLGVGLGNFIPSLPIYSSDKEVIRFLQPGHNIYLLTLAETGIIGLFLLVSIIIYAFKKAPPYLKISLISIIFLGFFDHYFITLQQAQLLFVLIISLSLILNGKAKK